MLTATEMAGFIGAGLAGAAYLPQIWHLVREHCSAGISRLAFGVWLVASLLVTTHAMAIRAGVFIVLGSVQIVATTVILLCATKYASSYCASHARRDLDLGADTKPRIIDSKIPSSAPALRRSEGRLELCKPSVGADPESFTPELHKTRRLILRLLSLFSPAPHPVPRFLPFGKTSHHDEPPAPRDCAGAHPGATLKRFPCRTCSWWGWLELLADLDRDAAAEIPLPGMACHVRATEDVQMDKNTWQGS